jgi:RNA polymerase sigma-70 factor (ECF subfamily)
VPGEHDAPRDRDDARRPPGQYDDHAREQADASKEVRGAAAVAETFSGRAWFARPALVNGAAGAVWAPGGRPRVVFDFTITRGKIAAIDILADPAHLRRLDLSLI